MKHTALEADDRSHIVLDGTAIDMGGSYQILRHDAERFVKRDLRGSRPATNLSGDHLTNLAEDA